MLAGITGAPVGVHGALGFMVLLALRSRLLHSEYLNLTFRNILMFAAMSYGWNMIGGYTGYVWFGNVVFFGIGAYCSAVLGSTASTELLARRRAARSW